ncbi:alpha-S1-casein [Dasypus novemcinctus]|uniref:alpha-S1-casein n=1 Tax=Dasypus novemcinctus TaxID=9361 RepID=UPI000C846329|nr:alpha-S1-casein [Dasypus novemcinctus]
MKLLILTCLVAVALARPKFSFRYPELSKNELDSSEEILKERKLPNFVLPIQREEYSNEQIRQRELLREKGSDEFKATRKELSEEHAIADAEQKKSGSSSSEEVIPSSTEQKHIPQEELYGLNLEQILKWNKYKQLQQEAVHDQRKSMRAVNQEQAHFYRQPFQLFYQPDVYPFAYWYYLHHAMPFMALRIHEISKPIASENFEITGTAPSDW